MHLPTHDHLTDVLTKVSTNRCFEGRIMIYRYEKHLILPPIIIDLPILACCYGSSFYCECSTYYDTF